MVAKEFYLGQISLEETGDEESTLLQDPRDDSDAEAEEALSLCDLPLYSNSSISPQWGGNNFSKEYEKNSSSQFNNKEQDDDDDFFEFFSEDFTTSNSTTNTHHHHHRTVSDNIIFCGKLIPFKDTPKNENPDESNNIIRKGSNTLVPWRSNSSSRSNSKAMMVTCNYNKKGGHHGGAKGNSSITNSSEYSSIGKVSLLRSPTKSRWFLFMFGMTRLSTNTGNMELRDIRSRQSRNSRRTKFAATATPENRGEVVEEKMMKEEGKGNCKGLWKVLRSISVGLGCTSSKLANDVVRAAFV